MSAPAAQPLAAALGAVGIGGFRAGWGLLWPRFVRGIDPAGAGWATRSLASALRDAFCVGTIGLQVLLALGTIVDRQGAVWSAVILLGAVAVAVSSAQVMRGRLPAWVLVHGVAVVATVATCLASSPDGLLLFAAVWTVHLATALPAVSIRGWSAFVIHSGWCLGASVALWAAHPEWGPSLPEAQLVSGYAIMVALRAGVAVLAELASQADRQIAAEEESLVRMEQRRIRYVETAERARILHDTVINTFAAVASGGGATRDSELVRGRCREDARSVQALLDGDLTPTDRSNPLEALGRVGLLVRRTGVGDDELRQLWSRLPGPVAAALERSSYEAVQNVSKHAGVDQVVVDVSADDLHDHVQLTVTDDGVGFVPDPGRRQGGLRSSVVQRARDFGIDVEVTSAPGNGTTVTLRAPLNGSAGPHPRNGLTDLGNRLVSVMNHVCDGATWLWAAGVLVVGVLLDVCTHPGVLTPTYGALALGLLAIGIAWVGRAVASRSLGIAVDGFLQVLVVGGFLLSAATSDFGRDDPIFWQALADTGTLVLLHARSARAGRVGIAVHMLTAGTVGVLVWPQSSDAALTMLTGAVIAVLFVIGWMMFVTAFGNIGNRLAAGREKELAARVEEDVRNAASAALEAWRGLGLQRARVLLLGIAHGRMDPREEAVRRACGEEEAYLRAGILLSPDLIRLGPWLLKAIGAARGKGVRLRVSAGAEEPADDGIVEDIGGLLMDAVARVDPGSEVTIGLHPVPGDELLVTIVAPHPQLAGEHHMDDPVGTAARLGVATYDDQDILEARFPRGALRPSVDYTGS